MTPSLRCIIFYWLLELEAVTFGYLPDALWPEGRFSLPATRTGCPESSDFAFEVGTRTFDCEDDDPFSAVSTKIHLEVRLDAEKDIHLNFCSKTVTLRDKSKTGGPWPSGQYCFFQVGDTCPGSFSSGWILWQDERTRNRNTWRGVLPKGEYRIKETKMYFCCRTDGNPDKPIKLPRERDFALLKYGDKCQQVEGTEVRTEFILWDNDRREIGQESHSGTIPSEGVTDQGDVKLEFCYYSKIDYCGSPGIPANGKVEGDSYISGGILNFSCDSGYELEGSANITCLTTERWSAPLPTCKEVNGCEVDESGEGPCDHVCIDLEGAGGIECACMEGFVLGDDGHTCRPISNENSEEEENEGETERRRARIEHTPILLLPEPERNVALRCSVSGYPIPAVSWWKNGVRIDFGRERLGYSTGNGANLVIRDPSKRNNGLYTCRAVNDNGEADSSLTAVIVEREDEMGEDDTPNKICKTSGPFNKMTFGCLRFTWLENRCYEELDGKSTIVNRFVITLDNRYKCTGENLVRKCAGKTSKKDCCESLFCFMILDYL